MPPPLTVDRVLSSWTLDGPVVLIAVVVSIVYLWGARRRGDWPRSRTILFVVGIALSVLITCSVLGVYAHSLFWALAVQDILLLALVPLPLVLGQPLQLFRTGQPRVGLPPALGALGGLVALLALYVTDLDRLRLEHQGVLVACQVGLVVIGCGFIGPLLGTHGGSYGGRTLVAFVDGLLDAVPGIAVLSSHGRIAASYYAQHPRSWGPGVARDQEIGGSAMVALAEIVGLPTFLVLLVQWVRSDAREATRTDLVLDALTPVEVNEPMLQRPWWEVDPGPLDDRVRRQGWNEAGQPP